MTSASESSVDNIGTTLAPVAGRCFMPRTFLLPSPHLLLGPLLAFFGQLPPGAPYLIGCRLTDLLPHTP